MKKGAFTRLAAAAALAGITVEVMRSGIKSGVIPLQVYVFGRIPYVASTRLAAWLHSAQKEN